jgi:cytochrome c-type biogenesis protein CcmE
MVAIAIRARRRRRLGLVAAALAALGVALGLALFALRDSITLFLSPTDLDVRLARGDIGPATPLRIGGLVKEGTLVRGDDRIVRFRVTDNVHEVAVTYQGLLPDLFREGQGVVAEGRMTGGEFHAATILAKHDERYMPREVADALKKQGVWQGGSPPPAAGRAP